ncbi:SMI1/KNR4 family protein [Natrinema sp. J7-2]|uniref:SMI1/KNR4 family protein n=1 Tax=Natrinema sp. (strain J7-2) TaxID=406552 RepID=UPI00026D4564|nr:SMI1/KNR4 family protein [Natrinema sp. J7-2]AFO57637.1 KNR4-like cell wall assembly/cell proliferation coordinating protein [Natrinema sp. J7-2]
MEERWDRVREWLETNAPDLTDVLRPGATDADISRAESGVGLAFPPSVRESYRIHNGQEPGTFGLFGGWQLLPLTDVVREWEKQREIERDFEFGHWDPDAAIPIIADGGGNFLYVEHAPDGAETPVIEWWHEDPTRDVQASSFAAYLDAFLDALEASEYVYLEDDAALVHEDDL